jgi:hypothetical protein
LAELVNPKSFTDNHYLVNTSSDAGQLAINFERAYEVYRVFRFNADFVLFTLACLVKIVIFLGNIYFDKGRVYYNFWAGTLKKSRGGRSRLSDLLEI